MKLKEITPSNGNSYFVGAGVVHYNNGWFVGGQPITDELFAIIGELPARLDRPPFTDKDGDPVTFDQTYYMECKVITLDHDDDERDVEVEVRLPSGQTTEVWVNSASLNKSIPCSK